MADDDENGEDASEGEEEAPAVALGEGGTVEGAPLARVASRLTWPIEQSEIDRKEGDTAVRTPDGPTPLSDLLDEVDITYFATRREFTGAVREVAGAGPIPTE